MVALLRTPFHALACLAFLVAVAATATAVVFDNGVYEVHVAEQGDRPTRNGIVQAGPYQDASTGRFSLSTGPSFAAAGEPENNRAITFNRDQAQTSVLSIKSYDSDLVYGQTTGPESAFWAETTDNFAHLEPFYTSHSATATSSATTWTITGTDELTVTQTLSVGSTALPATSANSYIRLQIEVCNNADIGAKVGMRSLWNLKIATDDGAYVQEVWTPTSFTPGGFANLPLEVDNPTILAFATGDFPGATAPPAPPATFYVFGLVNDPASVLLPAPVTPPDRFLYWQWFDAGVGWEVYDSTSPVTDSAAVYYWGYHTPIPLARAGTPGDCVEANTYVTLDLSSVLPPVPPSATLPPIFVTPAGVPVNLNPILSSPTLTCAWTGSAGAVFGTPTLCPTTVTFASGGTYTATITVEDTDPNTPSGTTTVTIRVLEARPGGPHVGDAVNGATIGGSAALPFTTIDCTWTTTATTVTFADPDLCETLATGTEGIYPLTLTVRYLPVSGEVAATTPVTHSATTTLELTKEDPTSPTQDPPRPVKPREGTDDDLAKDHSDNDGIPDGLDNCVSIDNANQADLDGDGVGNVCDGDQDGDGLPDNGDSCDLQVNDGIDTDRDGLDNACDADDDADGVPDATMVVPGDNCRLAANPGQEDLDMDFHGDRCDGDADGDGVPDLLDAFPRDDTRWDYSDVDLATASRSRTVSALDGPAPDESGWSASWLWVVLAAAAVVVACVILATVRRR